LAAASGKTVPDVIGRDLSVLFCGINPGLYTAAVGHHFARPGNRFWLALHGSGFTDRLLSPFEDAELVRFGVGITNLVRRATATAAELPRNEISQGARALHSLAVEQRPAILVVLGMGAFRTAFSQPRAVLGPQAERIGEATVWLLPNPSGLQARYQLPDLVTLFEHVREAAALPRRS